MTLTCNDCRRFSADLEGFGRCDLDRAKYRKDGHCKHFEPSYAPEPKRIRVPAWLLANEPSDGLLRHIRRMD